MKTLAKITFLIVTAILFANTKSIAQCTPATTLNGYGIFPDTMATAHVNIAYQQIMQFESPIDTSIIYLGVTVQAKVDSIKITGVIGMPSGFTYQCNKPNCKVNGGEIGCVMISGTTTQAGLYPLNVILLTNGRAKVFGNWISQSQTDTNKHYSILVKSPTGIFEIIDHSKPLKVYPNPAQNKLFIDARSVSDAKAIVKIFDINGKLVKAEQIDVYNNPSIEIGTLNAGIYFAEINDGSKSFRAKFIKE